MRTIEEIIEDWKVSKTEVENARSLMSDCSKRYYLDDADAEIAEFNFASLLAKHKTIIDEFASYAGE